MDDLRDRVFVAGRQSALGTFDRIHPDFAEGQCRRAQLVATRQHPLPERGHGFRSQPIPLEQVDEGSCPRRCGSRLHCVANRPSNPERWRMLVETAPGRRHPLGADLRHEHHPGVRTKEGQPCITRDLADLEALLVEDEVLCRTGEHQGSNLGESKVLEIGT